jgi:hypothetical protein
MKDGQKVESAIPTMALISQHSWGPKLLHCLQRSLSVSRVDFQSGDSLLCDLLVDDTVLPALPAPTPPPAVLLARTLAQERGGGGRGGGGPPQL